MKYKPRPIPTQKIVLPPEIAALTETLAENTHNLWALHRMADGWTYGAHRDDAAKKTHCLVPYDKLPESEKEYDRTITVETLKALIVLGFRILPKKPTKARKKPAKKK